MGKENLKELRRQIDNIDKDLSKLLQKRLDLVEQIANYKAQNSIDVFDKGREEVVIANALAEVTDLNYLETIKTVFESIMQNSKNYQKKQIKSIGSSLPKMHYAVIGQKLSHSLSPNIHKIFFNKTGLNATYEQIEIEPAELSKLLKKLKARNLNGINVTIPYKTDIMESLDYISPIAQKIGAVNTIEIKDQFKGYNTDYYGFGRALDYYKFDIKDKRCAILGSGGSARAVAAYLEDNKASEIAIITRDAQNTSLKFPQYRTISINGFSSESFDLIVNATPVGMYPNQGVAPITKGQLNGASFVMDLIYNPGETLLLSYAKQLDIPCSNGLYMLVAQAISAQEIWQGLSYEQDIINEVFEALIKELS